MNTNTQLITVLILIILVAGCVTEPATISKHKGVSHYPLLKVITIEKHEVHTRDLSDPCDRATARWDGEPESDLDEVTDVPECSVSERSQSITIPNKEFVVVFRKRGEDLDQSLNKPVLTTLANLADKDVNFLIFGTAGEVGPGPEKLAASRAQAVKVRLIAQGISSSRIRIMPYDPSLPGLRAVVRVTSNAA